MRDQELVSALRCVSTAGGPIGDCKKCPFYKTEPVPEDLARKVNLTEWSSCDVDAVGLAAADRIANQNTHILALQKEIAGLRKAVRCVHDGLYLCDPEKNTVCKKSNCKTLCFHTTFPEFADALAETPAPQLRWIPVEERLPETQGWYHVAIRDEKTKRIAVELDLYAVETAKNFGHEIGFCKDGRWDGREKVIAWMPLLEPPEV